MTKYVDFVHVDPLLRIRDAFANLNSALNDVGNNVGLWLEVPEITVVDESGGEYAKAFFLDGEIFVDPLFDLVRDIEDR